MKKYIIIILNIFVIFTFSCNNIRTEKSLTNNPSYILKQSKDSLNIHFQSGFNGDSIFIENNGAIFKKSIKTNDILGFAFEKKYDLKNLNLLKIKVIKSNTISEIILDTIKSNYVGIWYSSKGGLKYYFSEEPFIYE